jgi:hypothetical protein
VDDLVEAKGTSSNAAGQLLATKVQLETNEGMQDKGQHVELEGLISVLTSDTEFEINGQKVKVTPDTKLVVEGGSNTITLALNLRVEVEGQVDSDGILVATKIKVEAQSHAELQGKVDSVAADGKSLVVAGMTVTVTDHTRYEDRSSAHVERFNLSNLSAGDTVRVRGAEVVTNGVTGLLAARLEREPASDVLLLGGTVAAVAAPNFTLLGQSIVTDANTVFSNGEHGALTADGFFAQANGKHVRVQASSAGGTLTATKVELNAGEDD